MPEAEAILARLDAVMAELAELRATVAAQIPAANGADSDDDLAADNLIDTHTAEARFGFPRNTIAKWCREESCGVRAGGRWLASVPRLQRRINGK